MSVCFRLVAGDAGVVGEASEFDVLRQRLAVVEQVLAERDARIEQLQGQLSASQARVAELERQLRMDSTNSSRPPSSDSPFDKPKPKSLRGKSGRKPGGQPGHPGRTLRQVDDPDEIVTHEPGECRCCGADLSGRPVTGMTRRQQFDIPPVKIVVTEHRMIQRQCACGATTGAGAPAGVNAPVQYGPTVSAICVYLYVGQMLSKDRAARAVAELFATPISAGTVSAMAERATDGLAGFMELVRARIAAAPAAHFDETGMRVAGKLHWVHSASTDEYSLIRCHPKRGRKAMDHIGVLPGFTGVAIHDAWAPYDTYTDAAHQLCGAHVLRELAAVTDTHDTNECWASEAADALVGIKNLADTAVGAGVGLVGIDTDQMAELRGNYRAAANTGVAETAARDSKIVKKHNALAKRLLKRESDYLRFTTDPNVSFDNNAGEREIRMIKLRQKVSGCLRSTDGAEQFCTIRSYLATAKKHGHGLLAALTTLAQGHPYLPATS